MPVAAPAGPAGEGPIRAALVAVATGRERRDRDSLEELDALVRSAGMKPVERRIFRRPRPDPALYLGSGAAEGFAAEIADGLADVVVFDHPISAVQQRNLERLWKCPVTDRTEVIIDIFSQRARSNEGKLQVELARLEHQSSRLVRMWSHLERQRGGIGLRGGPGERQIELDRRMIDERIKRLKERLSRAERQRRTRRKQRVRGGSLRVSLIGYTNAGKSTLFNRLTRAGAVSADQLFATLDPLTRRLRLGDGTGPGVELIVSDTVGFVRELPHGLVAAFKATLEETAQADLLLHVIDSSAPDRDEQIAAVDRVLAEIGAADVPQIAVFNKIDRTSMLPGLRLDAYGKVSGLAVSALTAAGIDDLKRVLLERAVALREIGEPSDTLIDARVDGALVEDSLVEDSPADIPDGTDAADSYSRSCADDDRADLDAFSHPGPL